MLLKIWLVLIFEPGRAIVASAGNDDPPCGVRTMGYEYSLDDSDKAQRVEDVEHANTCEWLCNNDPRCSAWSWYAATNLIRPTCILFLVVLWQYQESTVKVVSSRKCPCGVRTMGYAYSLADLDKLESVHKVAYANTCERYCNDDLSCSAWSWFVELSLCNLAHGAQLQYEESSIHVVSSRKCQCGVIHEGACYTRGILDESVSSADDCLHKCYGDMECQRWSWVRGEGCYMQDASAWQDLNATSKLWSCAFGQKCPCGVHTMGYAYYLADPVKDNDKQYFVENANACEEYCDDDPRCSAWTCYAFWNRTHSKCTLLFGVQWKYKESVSTAISSRKCQCGVIHEDACNARGSLDEAVSSADDCLNKCYGDMECQRWSWVRGNGCYMQDVSTWQDLKATTRYGSCAFGQKCSCGVHTMGYAYYLADPFKDSDKLHIVDDVENANACEKHCNNNPRCSAWTWYLGYRAQSSCVFLSGASWEYQKAVSPTVSSRKCPQQVSTQLITSSTMPTTTSSAITSTIPTPSRATTSALPTTTPRATTLALSTMTSNAMTKNVTAKTVLILNGALPSHSEVCQNSHPLIRRIKVSIANLMNATVDLGIMVFGVHSRGKIHRCTDIGSIRLLQYLRGQENQTLVIEHVLFVSSTAERNLEEVFGGDDIDLTYGFADVSDNYTVVSAITTTMDLEDKEGYFLDTTSVTPAPTEWNDWVYVICVVVSLMIVCGAYGGYICCFRQLAFGLNTGLDVNGHQIHAAVLTRNMVRDAPNMHQNRDNASHAGRARCLVRRTPSMPVNRETLENALDSGVSDSSIFSIVSDIFPETVSDSSSVHSIYRAHLPNAKQDRRL